MSDSDDYTDDSGDYSDDCSEATYNAYCKQFIQINGQNWCSVCNVKVPFAKNNYIQHVNGETHDKKINEIFENHRIEELRAYRCSICNILTESFVDHINSANHIRRKWQQCPKYADLKHYIYNSKDKSSAMALAYREIYDNLIKANNIKSVNARYLFCYFCKVNVMPGSEIDHIIGKNHKKNAK